MTDKTEKFTVATALRVQSEQVSHWKQRLNTKCWLALLEKVNQENQKLHQDASPYMVFRGQDIDSFVSMWVDPDGGDK